LPAVVKVVGRRRCRLGLPRTRRRLSTIEMVLFFYKPFRLASIPKWLNAD
jgi:hypothetical protein